MKKTGFYFAMIGIVAIVLAVMMYLLSIVDKTLARHALGFEDLWLDKPSMRTFDFYPYSGHHIQAHYHQVGPDTWNKQDFDVRSGDHGFFVDFTLDTPPPKQADEFRLILIGGSAAQGWGGRTNDDMFYRQLEQRVNKQLAQQNRATRLRIVNLAMGGSVSYQNFIALNLWGHNLNPDAILSFSGANEFVVYDGYRSNLYFQSQYYGGFTRSQRFSESPPWQKFLAQYYPGLFRYSVFAQTIRSLYLPRTSGAYQADYVARFPKETSMVVGAVNFYSHALESIMRDFPRARLLLVTQPLRVENISDYETMNSDLVDRLVSNLGARLAYIDAHSFWKKNEFFPGSLVDGVHLSNGGHALVSEMLEGPVVQLISEMQAKLAH